MSQTGEMYVGKRNGRRPSEVLTGEFVHGVQAPGFYSDGNGLYLRVDASGSKRWVLRTKVQGRRRDIGLGGFSYTSLMEARARARILRKIAREGGDPLEHFQQKWIPVLREKMRSSHAIECFPRTEVHGKHSSREGTGMQNGAP
jgi:hypothetical protein